MFKSILVPVDVDDPASYEKTLTVAAEFATTYGSQLHAITVIPTFGMAVVGSFFPPDYEKKATARAHEAITNVLSAADLKGHTVTPHIAHGTIYVEVLKAAKQIDADLIIMASHRPKLEDYMLGPNAAKIARHAKQSVFIIRPS